VPHCDLAGVLCLVDHTHSTAAYFLKHIVMANGRADHRSPPSMRCVVQMLRGQGVKGNGNRCDLLDAFPG